MKTHKTGWICWQGLNKTWHRTYDAAERQAVEHQDHGLPAVQVDCCAHGETDCQRCLEKEERA